MAIPVFPSRKQLHLPTLFDDHPPTEERIGRLMSLARRDDGGQLRKRGRP